MLRIAIHHGVDGKGIGALKQAAVEYDILAAPNAMSLLAGKVGDYIKTLPDPHAASSLGVRDAKADKAHKRKASSAMELLQYPHPQFKVPRPAP